ncbi:MAG TPA: fatty acid desaturase [Pyrinomonadaceae bacterium]|jgi:stearoyl-CoA desaturase (delta-9 desaturase)|nr:fatty acid desaturase [Pyrinomonadaceae bacterium]
MYNQIVADQSKKSGINWGTAFFITLFHVGAVAALFMFSWKALLVTAALWWVTGSLGIGMGFHRLLTHRGYKTPKAVEYFLTLCGVLTLESGPISWVVTHRIHHAHTDTEGDPHSPRDGAWWSHLGWMVKGTAQQHEPQVLARYAPDLVRDPFHQWLNRWYFLPVIASGLILLVAGGWSMLMWGVFFRITFGWHATWLVNSATHMWGTRRFVTTDDSTNNFLVAILTFGEGWHNNHHAHPTAARHGLTWYEIDVNWWGIRGLQLLGLAKSVKLINLHGQEAATPKPDLLKAA